MNTIIKSTIAVCGFLAAVSAPLTAGADTSTVSSKGVYGHMSGYNSAGTLLLNVDAYENTTQSKSKKTGLPGASAYGEYRVGLECWFGEGSTDTIQFKANGSLPKQVTASGEIEVVWTEYCNSVDPHPTRSDKVTFNMNLTAMSDKASSYWGTTHSEYGNIRVNYHYDTIRAPATVNASSSLSSELYGAVNNIDSGDVGRSKTHNVEITK